MAAKKIAACVAAQKMRERKKTEKEKQSTAVEGDTKHHAADLADFMEEGDPGDVKEEE